MSLILSEELEASPVEDQKLQQKDRKGVKGKAKKKVCHYLITQKHSLVIYRKVCLFREM